MYRNHTCGELNLSFTGRQVILAGWVQRIRKLGGMTFIDLRDRYGITQLVVKEDSPALIKDTADSLGREFVVTAQGIVVERSNKNTKIPTGDIEIELSRLEVLNPSRIPPFTIEEESDGGEELRARYRYLDLRRP
ncbi:MAG TPA: aspartate--tRNA ligase, partial [Rikenellaceae bacterium]|nr:aspartate--tRNA ligase [Rikenellaceae bacterium]